MTTTLVPTRQALAERPRTTGSIYQEALGDDFDRLHPRMQERFGFSSRDGIAHIGRGVMHRIERHSRIAAPFLRLLARRNILFPDTGTDVEFSVANYAYVDSFGRETVTWHRTFGFPKRTRVFDATMIYNRRLGTIVDYLGTHQQIAADLHCWVDDDGGMNFTSTEQRLFGRWFSGRIPDWMTGAANVREWWDDTIEAYRIDVHVTNPLLGTIVRYQGTFNLEVCPILNADHIPAAARPQREEVRD